jgi:hypothetical protein
MAGDDRDQSQNVNDHSKPVSGTHSVLIDTERPG